MGKTKTTTDEEIKQLYKSLNALVDTLPSYIPQELKELRDMILNIHTLLETAMESCIIYEIDKGFGINTSTIDITTRARRLLPIEPVLNNLSFRGKLKIIESYKNTKDGLIETLGKVNKYRNKFVHPKEFELKREFNANSPEGKQNIRDLLRCLAKAIQETNLHFKKNYVNKS